MVAGRVDIRPAEERCLDDRSLDPPKVLGFQLANTWPKITAHDVYGMIRKGKEPENLDFSSVAATVEKASTYVFAERLIRNAEVRGSTPFAPPFSFNYLQPAPLLAIFAN